MIIDEYHNDSLSPDLLDGIQITQRIHLIKPAIAPHTRTCPSIPHIRTNLLNLQPPLLSPIFQELLVIARDILAPLLRQCDGALPLLCHRHADVLLAPPSAIQLGLLVAAGVRDDALDACDAAIIEILVGQAEAAVDGGHAHVGVDEGPVIFFLLVRV